MSKFNVDCRTEIMKDSTDTVNSITPRILSAIFIHVETILILSYKYTFFVETSN